MWAQGVLQEVAEGQAGAASGALAELFVSHCDQIAVIADGRIAEQRSFKKLIMVSNSENEEDKEDMTSAECLENSLAPSSDERRIRMI
ncbi:hypothetical protein GN244_ATG03610 [Phytophthora infestans]|uniref:Uncharacterized protein n=1 Tax=Phytophthora infestans TaxID=4787 RepID=A0A833TII2_PHYIN|nr:hypothetical protein GN244_ATG03610 [Phytophthora infestans]KAF4132780.1 hypothetical protein GN958_ATG18078 [Phytophthora infestans]